MNTALKAFLIAGLIAGLVMGLFHFFFTEPVIDQAIAMEIKEGGEVVSRGAQKGILIVGSALYGLLVGAILAFVFIIMGRRLPGRRPVVKAAELTGLLWWSVAFLPFLKYPANPPGVGDPDTMYFRQIIQIGFIVFSALAMITAGATYWLLRHRWRETFLWRWRLGITTGFYGILIVLLFILMPVSSNTTSIPANLIRDFRILSLSGQVLFWVILGGISALLLKRLAEQAKPS
ncbi:MAG: CbtA family protein [Dehalococcoidia bacterium]|nr:CbtA family protein [Dehalococcoidia bacterium]MDZ4247642.1 CbtA family protein [Dehalococcoidia bacterium]